MVALRQWLLNPNSGHVNIPQEESYIYVVAMASLSSMVAVFYSSLYFFSAHRYVQPEANENYRITSDDESTMYRYSVSVTCYSINSSTQLVPETNLPYSLSKFHFVFTFVCFSQVYPHAFRRVYI